MATRRPRTLLLLLLLLVAAGPSAAEKLLFDTGVVELSRHGPLFPDNYYGNKEYQSHVALPHFNWESPFNYAEGRIHIRMDIVERPGLKPFGALFMIQQDGKNGDHWWGPPHQSVVEPGIHLRDVAVQEMRDARDLLRHLANPPALRMAFAVQKAGGTPNSPWTDAAIFPMRVRFSWVAVAKGATFSGWEAHVGPDRPILTPLGTRYAEYPGGPVTMSTSTPGAEIRYTTDGTTPTAASRLYVGPVPVGPGVVTVKARTFKPGAGESDVSEATYATPGDPARTADGSRDGPETRDARRPAAE